MRDAHAAWLPMSQLLARSLGGTIKFEGIKKKIKKLEKAENIDESLIRYLTVRVKKHDLKKNYFEKKINKNEVSNYEKK